MFQHQGIWLPDGEKHFPLWMDSAGEIANGRGTYQIKKWRACLPWIKGWVTAVDIGAHVGFWSIQMLPRFARVMAFEPMTLFRECFESNVGSSNEKLVLHPVALGAERGFAKMAYDPADSGNTHVAPSFERGETPVFTLDSFGFHDVGFIKIDCEGFEHNVVLGAQETITRCRPCIIVEQKQHKMAQNYPGQSGTPAVDLLLAMGMKQRALLSGDHILSFD